MRGLPLPPGLQKRLLSSFGEQAGPQGASSGVGCADPGLAIGLA